MATPTTWDEAAEGVLENDDNFYYLWPLDLAAEVDFIARKWEYAFSYRDGTASEFVLGELSSAAGHAFDLLVERNYGVPDGTPKDEASAKAALLDLLVNRQRKYGPKNITKFGLTGILIRLHDKIERLRNLANGGDNAPDESIDDTLADIVGYYVIARMLDDGTFELPLKQQVAA